MGQIVKLLAILTPIIVFCIAFAVLLTTVIIPKKKNNAAVAKYGQEFVDTFYSLNVGDTFIFGSYEQDNNTANGKEDIEWPVLAKDGDRVLLISRYALDCQRYNTSYFGVTWETCSLRKWLNGTFLNAAFSEIERTMIPSVTISADKNSGNSTTDQVFLLSIAEASKYFTSDSARQCQGTSYCYAKGADKDDNGNCWWWLRSPGDQSGNAAVVGNDGLVDNNGNVVLNDSRVVRPALWIDPES